MDVDKAGGGERPPSEKELFRSAESGDAAAFASLAPADLSLRNEDGRSLLHVAVAAGHPQVVLPLSQCGADAAASVLNAQDKEGWAPVHSASSSGNSHIIDILLERGADVNLVTDDGRTALHYAVNKGKLDIAEKLIAYGANVNKKDKLGCTPLHRAACAGNVELCELLANEGAEVDAVDKAGQTPLMMAVRCENSQAVVLLIRHGAVINKKDELGCTPLHRAASAANVELCELLAKEGADVDAVDKAGQTPLMIAVGCENRQVAVVLITHSTDVKRTPFNSDYYIKLLHSRFQRINQAPLHCCDDSPPPILQLTFHSDFDCNTEFCHDPLAYFRVNRAIYFMPDQRLVEKSDGTKCTLSKDGQRFLSSLNRIVEGNNSSGYCIAPSIHQGNVAMSSTTAEAMLLVPKCYRLGEKVDGEVMTKSVSYIAAADYFECLLKEIEGDDIVENLCDSVKDLLLKMRWRGVQPMLAPLLEKLIQNHPCLMGTEALIYFIREADMVLNREFRHTGSERQKEMAKSILRNLPYLPYGSHEPWTEIAKRHSMLNYWYRFRQDSASNNPKAGKSKAIPFRDQHKARLVKQGHIDSTVKTDSEKLFERLKLGSGLVSLHRDAVAHPYEEALEKIEMVSKVWPLDLRYIVSVLIVNYPVYLPRLSENIAICGQNVWDRFAFDTCFPRTSGIQKDRAVRHKVAGLQAFLVKILSGETVWDSSAFSGCFLRTQGIGTNTVVRHRISVGLRAFLMKVGVAA